MHQRPPEYPQLRSRNRKGDIAEMAFLARAMRFGFNVCRPFNSDSRYDVLVEAAGRYSRVQVKSTWCPPAGSTANTYVVRIARTPRGRKVFYRCDETDFFAAYVAPEDAWYIIPYKAVPHQSVLALFPHKPRSRGRLEIYREAWDLFLPKGMAIVELKAAADFGDGISLPHLGREWPGYNPFIDEK